MNVSMRLGLLGLLLGGCRKDEGLGGLTVVEEGSGPENELPLFDPHPHMELGLRGGWIEVDGQRHLRLEAGNTIDHSLYQFDEDGNVYLSGIEGQLLDTPAIWVPATVRDGLILYQEELDRTLEIVGLGAGSWRFIVTNGTLDPEIRERTETDAPLGFYEMPFPDYGNALLQPSILSTMEGIYEGPVAFEEAEDGTFTLDLTFVRYETDDFQNYVPRTFPQTITAVGAPMLGSAEAGRVLTPSGIRRPLASGPADSVTDGANGIAWRFDEAGRRLEPVRAPTGFDQTELAQGDDTRRRYFTHTPSGRVDRLELTDAGVQRWSLGSVPLPEDASLTAVWERQDGHLQGLIVVGIPRLGQPTPTTQVVDLGLAPEGVPQPVYPVVLYRTAGPDGSSVARCSTPDMGLTPAGPALSVGCELLEDVTELTTEGPPIEGTDPILGGYRLPYTFRSGDRVPNATRARLTPLDGGYTLATENGSDRRTYLGQDFSVIPEAAMPYPTEGCGGLVARPGCIIDRTWYRPDGTSITFETPVALTAWPTQPFVQWRYELGSGIEFWFDDGTAGLLPWTEGAVYFADEDGVCWRHGPDPGLITCRDLTTGTETILSNLEVPGYSLLGRRYRAWSTTLIEVGLDFQDVPGGISLTTSDLTRGYWLSDRFVLEPHWTVPDRVRWLDETGMHEVMVDTSGSARTDWSTIVSEEMMLVGGRIRPRPF